MSMIVAKGQTRELVLYWFQTFDNAFVRVSVPIYNQTQTAKNAFAIGLEFVEAFYPSFLNFVKQA